MDAGSQPAPTLLLLPDPGQLAAERSGAERAAALMAEGEASRVADLVATVVAAWERDR